MRFLTTDTKSNPTLGILSLCARSLNYRSFLQLRHSFSADGLHFKARTPGNGRGFDQRAPEAKPLYKDPKAPIEARVNDLIKRMSLEEKVSQLIQGDMNGWMDFSDPLDNTLSHNQTGLEEMMRLKGGSIWGGYSTPYEKFVYGVEVAQRYLVENTTLGIPAIFQSEGLHGFTNNGTIFPSPIAMGASFDTGLLKQVGGIVANESEGLGITQLFAPCSRSRTEQRFGRVEEGYGEDPHLTGEMGLAYVQGIQEGKRRNVTASTATARVAATCKHFSNFGSPQGGLNLAQVSGGEREQRTTYLKPFHRACMESLAIMTSYNSYDGIPVVNSKHLLTDILRDEWGYKFWVTSDAGAVDLPRSFHYTCDTRECCAKRALENGLSGEMGGDQVKAGTVNVKFIDETVKALLRVKFTLGLFENPYPYADYASMIRTTESKTVLHQIDTDSIVLLKNDNNLLPLSKSISSVALLGPHADRVTFGDYTFLGQDKNGITPLAGFKQFLADASSSTKINYAKGCELWSNDQSGFDEAVQAAQNSEVAIVMVGTWSQDQSNLWAGVNATTGEHVDVADLALVGAQLALVKAVQATGTPTVVVFVAGKPVAEPWIKDHANAVIAQFYGGEHQGPALADIVFGKVSPSGVLPISIPRSVGTLPAFYNYLKGSRPIDPGFVGDDGHLVFGHQASNTIQTHTSCALFSFGEGLSYTTFEYSGLQIEPATISPGAGFTVSVTVRNSGSMDSKEVVQVYLVDNVSSVVTPNQYLAGFTKVLIPAGQSQTVSVPINGTELAVWTLNDEFVVEPGTFTVKVGNSVTALLNGTLTVS
ncbi:glycoside hydrolase superfamily [Flagelloscypha sp. PMI_526]|nr:glycoside hydrolase superfamily [Flagelloscypha sp. PMI_526]